MYCIIAAVSKNYVIGKNNSLPWNITDELKYFKNITTNGKNCLIVGRKTYETLPNLKNRDIFILTKNSSFKSKKESDKVFFSINSLLEYLKDKEYNKKFIIGGSAIYKSFLEKDIIDEIYLSKININIEGDCYFPDNSLDKFSINTIDKKVSIDNNSHRYVDINYIHLKRTNNNSERQYLNLVKNILENGNETIDRTNTGTISVFGNFMKFNLQNGFPLLTTKKMFSRGIIEELLWFLSGSTNANILTEKNVHIWDGNTSRECLDSLGFTNRMVGDGGPIYGFQFRHFGAEYKDCNTDYTNCGIDQLQNAIHLIKTEPNSRRIIINLWDSSKINEMVLPPCHILYNFKVEGDKLSLCMYQRSGDIGLGVPFNIASSALLVHIIAKLTNLKVGFLTHFIGDAHIYKNHVDALKKQLKNKLFYLPKLKIKNRNQIQIEDFESSDFEIIGYESNDKIHMEMAV